MTSILVALCSRATSTILFITCLSVVLSSCSGSPMHYRSYLYEPHPESPEKFIISPSNAITILEKNRLTVELDEVHLGFIHREMARHSSWGYDEGRGFFTSEYQQKDGLGGRELWMIADIVSVDPGDPLGLKRERSVYASSIKLDQESFAFVPLNNKEKVILDTIANKGYRIDFRVYSVHGVELKRLLLLSAKSSLGMLAWDALKAYASTTWSFLGEGIFAAIEDKAKEPLFFEQILLKASAEVEMQGAFDLVPLEGVPESKTTYVLYDIVKSEIDRDLDGKVDSDKSSLLADPVLFQKYRNVDSEGNFTIMEKTPLIDLPKDMISYVSAYQYLHKDTPIVFPTSKQMKTNLYETEVSAFLKKNSQSFVRFIIKSTLSPSK